jgi:hypothetical protein
MKEDSLKVEFEEKVWIDFRVGDWFVADGCAQCDRDDVTCGAMPIGAISDDGWIRFVRPKGVKFAFDTMAKIHIEHVRRASSDEIDRARYDRKPRFV